MPRKLFLTSILMTMASSNISQTLVGIFACFMYSILCSHVKPFKKVNDYNLTMGSQFIIFVSMQIGLFSKVTSDIESNANIGATLIILNGVLPCLSILYLIFKTWYKYTSLHKSTENRLKVMHENANSIRTHGNTAGKGKNGTQVAPVDTDSTIMVSMQGHPSSSLEDVAYIASWGNDDSGGALKDNDVRKQNAVIIEREAHDHDMQVQLDKDEMTRRHTLLQEKIKEKLNTFQQN